MQAGSATTNAVVTPSPPRKIKKVFFYIGIILLLELVILLGIWHFGSRQLHTHIPHPLYSSFDASPIHSKLLAKLEKSKLSVVHGSKEEGLIQFSEHMANKLAKKGKAVILQTISADGIGPIQIVRHFRSRLNQLVQLEDIVESTWIVQFQGETTVLQQMITNIQSTNPNSRIIIIATKDHKITGFKSFEYTAIHGDVLSKSIRDNLKVSKNVAAALKEHFQTHEDVYTNLDNNEFSHQQFLGQNHQGLDGLSKKDRQLLSSLCENGKTKAPTTNDKLNELGVISHKGVVYWSSAVSRLNYELNADADCKNSVVPQQVLRQILANREKEALEKKAKEEEQIRKAEQKRLLQEKKKLQEQTKTQQSKSEPIPKKQSKKKSKSK